ncbi:MAG: hypothetical protein ACE5GS_09095 [Kiloniellaceae bacterium]
MSRHDAPETPAAGPAQPGGTSNSAEVKRLAARRRFLLGGATALPVIVTLGQKQALAASAQVCASANFGFGAGFTAEDLNQGQQGQLAASVFCRPENL